VYYIEKINTKNVTVNRNNLYCCDRSSCYGRGRSLKAKRRIDHWNGRSLRERYRSPYRRSSRDIHGRWKAGQLKRIWMTNRTIRSSRIIHPLLLPLRWVCHGHWSHSFPRYLLRLTVPYRFKDKHPHHLLRRFCRWESCSG